MSAPPLHSTPPRRATRRILLGSFVFLCAALASLWLLRAPLLTAVARALVVDEPIPDKADAIIVLGGGVNLRPAEAAKLYRQGIAPRILVAQPEQHLVEQLGIIPAESEIAFRYLESIGVPSHSIEPFGHNLTSTYEEALAVRAWLATHPAKCLVIPTDAFHSRRVNWTFEKLLRGTGVEVRVTTVPPPTYTASDWWRHEEGFIAVQNEYLKSIYYWLKY